MLCLVTGVAGFVGSHLAERLIADGHEVRGIDCFTDFYERSAKEANLEQLNTNKHFHMFEEDLVTGPLDTRVADVDVIFHQAAQAGVRSSWGAGFAEYVHHNVLGTQRLLEAVRSTKLSRFIYASSSSVYGDTDDLPMHEDSATRPYSPYGVTKLSAEHLVELYRRNFGVPSVSLRYFTVYGPRQRPDMGFHRFIKMMRSGQSVPIYGDGLQTRDFTFISDIVDANVSAMTKGDAHGVYNIGGGARKTLIDVLQILEDVAAQPIERHHTETVAGDVRHTFADTTRAQADLSYRPRIKLREGLLAELEWYDGHGQRPKLK